MRVTLLALAVVTAGCGVSKTDKPAGPPFALEAPASLELRNGESRLVDVAVHWDKGEREDLDVSVVVEPDGRGVSAKVEKERLERGAGPAQLRLAATETAAGGDYEVTVRVKGANSGATAKKAMTLKVPRRD